MEPEYVRHIVQWVVDNFSDQQLATLAWVVGCEPTVKNGTITADATPTLMALLAFGLIRKTEDRLESTVLGKMVCSYLSREVPLLACEGLAKATSIEEAMENTTLEVLGPDETTKTVRIFLKYKAEAACDSVLLRWREVEEVLRLEAEWCGSGDMPEVLREKWTQRLREIVHAYMSVGSVGDDTLN